MNSLDTLTSVKVIAVVAGLAASVDLVEGSAEWIRLNADSVAEEGSLEALQANISVPPGT